MTTPSASAPTPSYRFVYRLCHAHETPTDDAHVYAGGEIDRRDGYIHLSTLEQARVTADLYFRGVTDLVLLQLPVSKLAPLLKWEPVPHRHNELMPHYYTPTLTLTRDLVHAVLPMPLGDDGKHIMPTVVDDDAVSTA